jgi:hypothetical protein
VIWRPICAVILLGLLMVPRECAAGSFGRTDLSGTVAADIENYIKGGVFVCNGDGAADSITVYLEVQSNSAQVRCAIYERTSGTAWQLIDSSAELACPVDTGWYTFPLLEGVVLSAGAQYALVAWAKQSASWNCRIHSLEGQGVAADSMFFKSAAYGAWPTPTVPTLIWYYDAVLVCHYSGAAAPGAYPASIDGVVNKGAYLK